MLSALHRYLTMLAPCSHLTGVRSRGGVCLVHREAANRLYLCGRSRDLYTGPPTDRDPAIIKDLLQAQVRYVRVCLAARGHITPAR